MTETMMAWGVYRFSIDTAAYQKYNRESRFIWAEADRITQTPTTQFTGIETEKISLDGVIYPQYKGGYNQLNLMRLQASLGVALPLITGTGAYLGQWVIETLSEGQEVFWANGVPRKVSFTVGFKKYTDSAALLNGILYASGVSGWVDKISSSLST